MATLLLHGLGADRRQPLELFGPVLADSPESVVALDVRAHGASPLIGSAADFTLPALAAELAASARAALPPGEPVTLIGISMGAALALRIALDELLPVRRAVFVRPAFSSEALPPNLHAFPVIAELLTRLGPAEGVESFRESSLYQEVAAASPAGGRGLLGQFTAPDAVARAVRLTEVPRNRAYRDTAELAALSARGVPALVVAAPRDPVHPVAVAAEWAEGLGAELLTVPARDDSQPAQTAALRAGLAEWLRTVD
ncbi:alpha/beta fold hydrolase [Microterricola viridarii]|uniref:Lysophospholipase, alpha-beta hydrolase superfamily n=1 Tax=Microterricola viridarii TaxID=412690 RepID=A0A1H1ZLJ6_9MICO|nr:alpha/beta hydrolase [Microterricola viridarii]SDT34479.1 Lysophospholipase, alpha-beta hydrolase superfamily [Microterricola viridarii]